MTRILVVDAATERRSALTDLLEGNGFTVISAGEVDVTLAASDKFDLMIAHVDPATRPGLRICRLTSTPVMIIASQGGVRDAVTAIKSGAAQFFVEPVDPDELIAAIEVELTANNTAAGIGRDDPIAGAAMVGTSEHMVAVYQRIEAIAPSDSPVLISGESGTGKTLVARTIHGASHRRHGPLITLNCAVVPDQLIEAELFGQETPAGAGEHRRPGLIEAAQGGSLFLDEIAELPSEAQARLVRLLQSGEYRPLGASRARPIDVRLLAGSHRDIGRLVAEGHFREDLFQRLSRVTLNLPPLRDRPEDMAALAHHLLKRICRRLARPEPTFTTRALAAMADYDWPGNVRELENIIERAVILAKNDALDIDLLAIGSGRSKGSSVAAEPEATTLEDYFVRFVLDNQDALTETELAAKLGISRKSLWERRQRLNIPRRATIKRGPRRHP